jgi:transcriptional regulator with XRE-family HTH domain
MKEKNLQSVLVIVGNKLIELRKKKGYSSHETFAQDFNLPRVQYWRLEKGRINFTFRTLCKVLAIHQLTVEEFFFMIRNENGDFKL